MMSECEQLIAKHMKLRSRHVPARLQAAFAILERVRDFPSTNLDDYRAAAGSSSLKSHEAYGNRAHERLGIEAINANRGRRSSNLQDWGQALLNALRVRKFDELDKDAQDKLIDGRSHHETRAFSSDGSR